MAKESSVDSLALVWPEPLQSKHLVEGVFYLEIMGVGPSKSIGVTALASHIWSR